MTQSLRRRMTPFVALATLFSLFAVAPTASAAPPGENGPIVHVVVGENATGGDLHTVQADGSGSELLLEGEFTAPDVSPDGTEVLAVELADAQASEGAVVSIDVATGESETLVESGATSAAWSGDGSAIAYATGEGLWVKEGTADAAQVDEDINMVWDWSPVDDRVLVTRNVDPDGVGLPEVSLETVDVGTGDAVVVESNDGGLFTWYVSGADFSPDGADIVYHETTPGHQQVVIAGQADPLDETEGATGAAPNGPVTWSPDGESIAYGRSTAEGDLVVVHTVASGAEVTFDVADLGPIDWAPVATGTPQPDGFTDVPTDHTFYTDIQWLAGEGITRGCNPPDNTLFCPDDFVTRGQMAAFLVRGLGYADDGGGDRFTDDDGSVFEGDIDRLATAGVTKGCNPPDNTEFCPDDFVTRGQMAAFLVRAFGYSDDGGGDRFTDDDGSVFEGDIDRLATAGVARGCNPPDNTEFCPGDFVTRGQMAAFLARAFAAAD
jgi:hypothetical protein